MKKLRFTLVLFLILSFTSSFSQNRSIQFIEKPWSEILQLARKENKMIFMDAYASWCGPCKWIAANIFRNDTVADYYNKTFICTKIDMEKGEGPKLAQKFEVKAYPTLMFFDTSGALVHKKVGADRETQAYIKMAMLAQDPKESLAFYIKQYNAGTRTPEFMITYLERISDTYNPVDVPLSQYFSTVKDEDLLTRQNWNIIYKYVNDMNSREFRYLVKHAPQFETLYTRDSVNEKISGVYQGALVGLIRSRNFTQDSYNRLRGEILNSGFPGAQQVVTSVDQWLQKSKEQ